MQKIPENIEKELTIFDDLTRRLLFNREIVTKKEAEEFLSPSYEDGVYDPFLMLNVDKAVNRIYEAVIKNEKICIYADYDCDGIPGAVIWRDLFEKIKFSNYLIYIPDRQKEGYGLNISAIEEIAKNNTNLLITVDLGITAIEEVLYAKEKMMDVIITDHHLPKDDLPDALVVVNPKQAGDTYPDEMLCGAGVTFKVIHGFIKKHGEEFGVNSGFEKWLLDMVGLATLADMVPLRKENRVLSYYGLKVLRKTKREGLLKLFFKNKIDPRYLNEDDITFSICPKLNAASRMDSPMRAFDLLAGSSSSATSNAEFLIKINNERKIMVANIMKSIKSKFSASSRLDKDIIVVGDPSWRPGVLGLVASKIVEEYKKTAFVWGLEEGSLIKGSCRSYGGVNLVDIMSSLPDGSLTSFGGHAGAGGFSSDHETIHFLEDKLNEVSSKIPKVFTEENLFFDCIMPLDSVNFDTFSKIEKFAPFGVGNPKPTFLFENIEIIEIKTFGKAKEHLELSFLNSSKQKIKAISFFKKPEDFGDKVAIGSKINLYATIEKSVFGYKKEIRLRIVDIK